MEVKLLLDRVKRRVIYSEIFTFLKSKEFAKAAHRIIHLIRHCSFVKVDGYIVEAAIKEFEYSSKYSQNLQRQNMEFKFLKHGELLPEFCYQIKQAEIEKRLNAGHICYVLKYRGNIVCSAWIGLGEIRYTANSIFLYSDSSTFTINSDQAWIYDVICKPYFRGRGLSTGLYNEIILRLKDLGINYIIGTVGLSNIGAIKVNMRNGFKLKKKVSFKRILFIKRRKRVKLSEEFNADFIQKHNI